MKTTNLFSMGKQTAEKSYKLLFTATFLMVMLGLSLTGNAQRNRSTTPGYYYIGSQNQVFQYNGTRTDQRGISNGGINVGPVGVQGYNNNYNYSYGAQRTQYQTVPIFYYSNGNSCSNPVSQYQMRNGSPAYYQNGQSYRPPVTQQNFYPANRGNY